MGMIDIIKTRLEQGLHVADADVRELVSYFERLQQVVGGQIEVKVRGLEQKLADEIDDNLKAISSQSAWDMETGPLFTKECMTDGMRFVSE